MSSYVVKGVKIGSGGPSGVCTIIHDTLDEASNCEYTKEALNSDKWQSVWAESNIGAMVYLKGSSDPNVPPTNPNEKLLGVNTIHTSPGGFSFPLELVSDTVTVYGNHIVDPADYNRRSLVLLIKGSDVTGKSALAIARQLVEKYHGSFVNPEG